MKTNKSKTGNDMNIMKQVYQNQMSLVAKIGSNYEEEHAANLDEIRPNKS